MTLDLRGRPPRLSLLARAAIAVAGFSICVTAYSALLLRTHAVDPAPGLGAFLSGLALAIVAAILGAIALGVIWRTGLKGGGRAFFAIVIAAAIVGGPAYVVARNVAAVGLDDVSTDVVDPPKFDRAGRGRSPGELPLPPAEFPADAAARQKASYPEIAPLRLAMPAEDVTNLAIGLVEARGWRVLGPTSYPRGGPPTGRIEAVAQTPLLSFRNDVAIRVRPDGDGAEVDMRSASRIGRIDFGSNARRIRDFLADLTAAANAAP